MYTYLYVSKEIRKRNDDQIKIEHLIRNFHTFKKEETHKKRQWTLL